VIERRIEIWGDLEKIKTFQSDRSIIFKPESTADEVWVYQWLSSQIRILYS